MAKKKKNRVPKHILGIKLPKRVRKSVLAEAVSSPVGQIVISRVIYRTSRSLVQAPARAQDSPMKILAHHPSAALALGRWKARQISREVLGKIWTAQGQTRAVFGGIASRLFPSSSGRRE